MQETRQYEVKNRIIGKPQLRALAATLLTAKGQCDDARFPVDLSFELASADGTSYKTQSIEELLAEGSAVDSVPTLSVSMSVSGYKQGARRDASISLRRGDVDYLNNMKVSGEDPNWVRGIFLQLKQTLDAAPPARDHFVVRHKTIVLHVLAVGLGYAFQAVIELFVDLVGARGSISISSPAMVAFAEALRRRTIVRTLLLLLVYWLQGLFGALWVRESLLKLWPAMEFDLGPEHLKTEKRRRVRLATIFAAIVLPLLLRTAYDFTKSRLIPTAALPAPPAAAPSQPPP